jgi:hypothetical protein
MTAEERNVEACTDSSIDFLRYLLCLETFASMLLSGAAFFKLIFSAASMLSYHYLLGELSTGTPRGQVLSSSLLFYLHSSHPQLDGSPTHMDRAGSRNRGSTLHPSPRPPPSRHLR